MNKKISLGAAIALVILTATVTVSITMVVSMRKFNQSVSDLNKRQAQYSYLVDIDKAIRQHYYGTIDEEKLHMALAQGMVNGLNDPYAAYLSADDYQRQQTETVGQKTGFGVEIALNQNQQIVIAHVDTDSPAQKAGVTAGSVIVKLDETAVETLSFDAVNTQLATSESVVLTLQTTDGTEAAYKISAGMIDMTSVTGKMLDRIGYIRIRAFRDNTSTQFRALYDSMIEDGAIAFIFDLRDNAGGSVEAMTSVLNYLMPSGQYGAIVDGNDNQTILSADGTHKLEYSSATLINGNTAGEAEMFAAVLSKFAASSTVGTQTAGRASVQSYYVNSVDGSAIKLTTGVFAVANQEDNWEGVGLMPVVERASSATETNVDLIPLGSDNQVTTALRLLEPAINNPDNATVVTTTTSAMIQTTTPDETGGTTVATDTKDKK